MGKKNCLQAGDQSHRAVLGQVMIIQIQIASVKKDQRMLTLILGCGSSGRGDGGER